ncbi:MAG TPA: GNAT family protein [Candidatus Dormibacteraeota bacterium]|nr:GNAT family protein [Candidatus Dormibacteraeota bacterium]
MEVGAPATDRGIRLRQATLGDVELLMLWSSSPRYTGEFNDFGLPRARPYHELITKNELIGPNGGTMMVERTAGGTAIGTVSWRQVRYGPTPESAAWNIGISLIPEMRGFGFGTLAQRLLADHLFATTSVNRIEAGTDIENLAEQRSLEKAGFTREGALRGAQYRAGEWHDLVIYALLRDAES